MDLSMTPEYFHIRKRVIVPIPPSQHALVTLVDINLFHAQSFGGVLMLWVR